MTKRYGFTLAEVLITLGIIGVVAAMTMPTLMNSTQGAQYKAAYKKALSALYQAVVLNVALDDYNFADLDADNYTLTDMLSSRMNVVRTETGSNNIKNGDKDYKVTTTTGTHEGTQGVEIAATNTTLFFNDGIMFSFPTEAKNCSKDDTTGSTTPCYGFIDVNGVKAPNKMVKCDSGSVDGTGANACQVTNPTDVYPVVFYDQTILPNSPAARAVLYAK
ncbi:MAG TPA: type II secretion system protein [Candidatus Stercorousia faecigallinarum]|nr:type II secretion system protein [Candidatus Stercorousia faecigallinarum]